MKSSNAREPSSRLMVLTALALLLGGLCPARATAAPPLGKSAPEFSLRDRDGTLVALGELAYSGPEKRHRPKQVVVLEFFRTDCKPCVKAMPKLIALDKQYRNKGVKVLLVALLEDDEGEAKLDAFFRRTPVSFPVLVDAYGVAGKKYVQGKEGRLAIPALFVIDKDGALRLKAGGLNDKNARKVRALLDALLGGAAPPSLPTAHNKS